MSTGIPTGCKWNQLQRYTWNTPSKAVYSFFFIYMIARACLSVCFTAIEQTSNFSSITNAATVLLGWFWINHILHCLWKSYITIKRFHKIDVFQNTYVYELFNSVYITYDLKKWFDLISETLLKSFLSHIISLFRPQRVWAFYITVRARLCQYRRIV